MNFEYKNTKKFNERSIESKKILIKYPNRLPIVVEKYRKDTKVSDIDKCKFLVPLDITIGQLIHVIRQRINLEPTKALFIFINGILPPCSEPITNIYHKYKDNDGFLYVFYTGENTYG